jgi:hypothetical protein
MEMNINFNGDERLVLICAFRYALGRMTYVVGTVVDLIRNNWHVLDDGTKDLFVREIHDHKRVFGNIGMDFDERAWMSIVEARNREIIDQENGHDQVTNLLQHRS